LGRVSFNIPPCPPSKGGGFPIYEVVDKVKHYPSKDELWNLVYYA